MDRHRFARIEDIFSAAVELPVSQRPAFLERMCGGSSELREDVERLLAEESGTHFLDRPVGCPPADWQAMGPAESSDDRLLGRQGGGRHVYVVSTPPELEAVRRIALAWLREAGDIPWDRSASVALPDDPKNPESAEDEGASISAMARRMARCDLVLAIIGWTGGTLPAPEIGGDGVRPWVYWELESAGECAKPVAVLMADDSLQPRDPWPAEQRSAMADLRGRWMRLATFFDALPQGEKESSDRSADAFRRRLEKALMQARTGDETPAPARRESGDLRHWPPPELPDRPYPLLLPYSHPELLAGREGDLDEVLRLLEQRIPILGIVAPSGTGKSSLLAGGLVPRLRDGGRPTALERHPLEPGLAFRLLSDLLDLEGGRPVGDGDPRGFTEGLQVARRLAGGRPPVLVVDQIDDLFPSPRRITEEVRRARASLGVLLAASAQRLPGQYDPACRWILACRQETQGQFSQWLSDVLREAREDDGAEVENLPHDFSGAERFRSWPLRPLATPDPGVADLQEASAAIFQEAIEKPLRRLDAHGRSYYPWRFAEGHATRLARAFAVARSRRPESPLVPELQAVLAVLLDEAVRPPESDVAVIRVQEHPEELINRALEIHLGRALDVAFPTALAGGGRVERARALLALRELADFAGRRHSGLPTEAMAQAIGDRGDQVLEALATPRTRLLIQEQHGGEWTYVLGHDRLADVLVRLFEDGQFRGLGVDKELLDLRRWVTLRCALWAAGDVEQATEVHAGAFRKIGKHTEALLWRPDQHRWWRASKQRWQRERRRRIVYRGLGGILTLMLTWIAWNGASQTRQRQALLEQVAVGDPEAAFEALDTLYSPDDSRERDRLLEAWGRRSEPFDVFDRGLGGVVEGRRADAVLRLAELAQPMLEASPEDPMRIASLVWALDFFPGRRPDLAQRTRIARESALGPLRRRRPPPTREELTADDWIDIPAGAFWMGSGPEEGRDRRDMLDERPRHRVTVSGFRMLRHEVTSREYRRLVPDHQGGDDFPAVRVNWYQAYTYAAWLGGRLPTEAEWEYAARAGCRYVWCRADGGEATVDEVAWWRGSFLKEERPMTIPMPVRGKEPNPWGLFDMLGNVGEWNADWHTAYPPGPVIDPAGPTATPSDRRNWRGGNLFQSAVWILPSARGGQIPLASAPGYGLRVVMASY